jgi:propanol-preferring alcohol dehydrogenase
VAHAADLLPLAERFDFLDGAVLACQAGTSYWGLRNIDTRASDRLLVTGLGPVGLLAVMVGQALNADVIGVDPSPVRRDLAQRLGLERALDPAAAPLAEQVAAIWPDGATAWAETSGNSAVHATIPAVAAINGRVAIIGLGAREPALTLTSLMAKQITIAASNLWPMSGWHEITEFVDRKGVPIRKVVTHELPIDEAPLGFALADSAAAGKVVFRFE